MRNALPSQKRSSLLVGSRPVGAWDVGQPMNHLRRNEEASTTPPSARLGSERVTRPPGVEKAAKVAGNPSCGRGQDIPRSCFTPFAFGSVHPALAPTASGGISLHPCTPWDSQGLAKDTLIACLGIQRVLEADLVSRSSHRLFVPCGLETGVMGVLDAATRRHAFPLPSAIASKLSILQQPPVYLPPTQKNNKLVG